MFDISQKNRSWVMRLHNLNDDEFWSQIRPGAINNIIERLENELRDVPEAKRMSYDIWHWRDQQAMQKFMTYWHLKYSTGSYDSEF